MKTWTIPVTWQVMGKIEVEADTLDEAIEIARDENSEIPCPDDNDYVNGSWEVDCDDEDFLREFYNDSQEDEEINDEEK